MLKTLNAQNQIAAEAGHKGLDNQKESDTGTAGNRSTAIEETVIRSRVHDVTSVAQANGSRVTDLR